MPDFVSAFLGAIIGGVFTLYVTRLKLRGRTDYFDDFALKHINELLKKKAPMSQLISWGKSIGMSESETRQLVFIAKCKNGESFDSDITERTDNSA